MSGMNIANSLVQSYLYADMYNREYEGGSDGQEKIVVGGIPVNTIFPDVHRDDDESNHEADNDEQSGGETSKSKKESGVFADKVVPAGLVLIQIRKDPDVEYEDHFHPGTDREVVPESIFDMLIGSVLQKSRKNTEFPEKRLRITPKKKGANMKKSESRRKKRV